ncbi:putative neural cell adhesion molecule 1 [Penaeus vannamei]|uniref:Putative neural cell adhesion molecule 1 n=1 Tax=Penaeus vannamei TaxID=6689 RepID=A0A423SF88_PENVA|nr:putative neural cell adhesion molecule 1 [Penaeus vannamei]
MGRALVPQAIQEGADVYFECSVVSNPPYLRVEWFHDGGTTHSDIILLSYVILFPSFDSRLTDVVMSKPIGKVVEHNMSAGVVVSGLSLVIRHLRREHSGSYTCAATNTEGVTTSNPVSLTVRHAPVCAGASQERTQGAARGAPTYVKCTVNAEPARDISWAWVRTLADGSEVEISEDNIHSEGVTSKVMVTPRTPEDYGQLLCRASNEVGQQRQACVVTLVPAGPPDTPSNCSASPVSPDGLVHHAALTVTCLEGFDGGLPQSFQLEVWQEGAFVANMSSGTPEWQVTGLKAGLGVTLRVLAHNNRGRSEVTRLELHTASAQHHAAPGLVIDSEREKVYMGVPPLLGALVGVGWSFWSC